MPNYKAKKTANSAPSTKFGDAKRFDLTLVSVENLQYEQKSGRHIKVYAKVQLDDGAVTKTGRYMADEPNSTLNLNFSVQYPIRVNTRGKLVVRLYYKRTLRHTLGEVTIDVTSLFDGWRERNSDQNTTMSFQLPKGKLNIAYCFASGGN
ncbi:hypothetical protein AAHA92_20787 [Salvia divinorum]|uniref:C2 domain-containing protein n=1 Tax=Salvia divinorum TaxID=28513 RepID=A0ABD1GIB9_SALDI